MKGVVYLLRNPIDGNVFYVGQTIYSMTERLRGHLSEKHNSSKSAIIKNILESGKFPIIEELESLEYNSININSLNERELFWIKHYNPIGNLLHVSVFVKRCKKCGNTFEAKRDRALYCSDVCRAASSKKNRVIEINNSQVFEKQKNCLYCLKEMEAKYRNKKFCSDRCRVYYNRENTIIKLEGVIQTETGIKIINPDNGVIVQKIKPPIKPKTSIEELKKQFPLEDTNSKKQSSPMPDPKKDRAAYAKWLREN